MVIATVDIGGTGIKFAAMSKEGEILEKKDLATPDNLGDLLAWLDSCLSKRAYQGIAMSVPYIHGFSWYDKLASYGLPIHLENDANCVGLSELLAHPELENAACVVVGTGIGGAMILNGRLHRGKHHLGGDFGYMLLSEPAETLGNWSLLASTGSLVRSVQASTGSQDWNGKKIYEAAAAGDETCQAAIEQMNRNLAKGLLNIQYLFDPDVISLGGSISQNPDFIQGVRSAIASYVDRYEEYSVVPEILACTYQGEANLYGALVNWLQEEGQWPHS